MRFYTSTAGTKYERMVIRGSGNVGIGTASPGAKLHIYDADTNATLKIEADGSDDSSDILIDRPNNVRRSDVQFTTADVIDWVIGTLYNGGAANSKFSISTTRDLADSKVTVDTTGFIGLGTTSPTFAKLHLEGSGNYDAVLRLKNTGGSGTDAFIVASSTGWGFGANRLGIGLGSPVS